MGKQSNSLLKTKLRGLLGFVLFHAFKHFITFEGKVLSIYFHNPSVALFSYVINWLLKNDFEFLAISELEAIIDNKTDTLRKKYVVITFDDGWRDNLLLLPIIKEKQLPITVFIPTQPIESGNYWWEFEPFKSSKVSRIKMKSLSEKDFQKEILKAAATTKLERSAMQKNELKQMTALPQIEIGSHTVTHPILTNLTNATIFNELANSKTTLEEWTGQDITTFSYPNGDYNDEIIDTLIALDYKMAFTTEAKIIDLSKSINKYKLPRFSINDTGGKYENLAKTIGVWQYFF